MLKIRLMRIGAKKKPFYRVVAVDGRAKRTGAYIELLGTYNPLTEPKDIKLKQDKIDYWIKQGAQPSIGFLRVIGKSPQRPPRKPKKEKKTKEPTKPVPENSENSEKQEADSVGAEDQNISESENKQSLTSDDTKVQKGKSPEVTETPASSDTSGTPTRLPAPERSDGGQDPSESSEPLAESETKNERPA